MVFNKLGENIEYKVEYKTYSPKNDAVDTHMYLNKAIVDDLDKIIAVYKGHEFGKIHKSELISMILSEFIASLTDEKGTLLLLLGKMKDYRERNNDYFIAKEMELL